MPLSASSPLPNRAPRAPLSVPPAALVAAALYELRLFEREHAIVWRYAPELRSAAARLRDVLARLEADERAAHGR